MGRPRPPAILFSLRLRIPALDVNVEFGYSTFKCFVSVRRNIKSENFDRKRNLKDSTDHFVKVYELDIVVAEDRGNRNNQIRVHVCQVATQAALFI